MFFSKLINFIFSVYFNFRYMPIKQAIYLPVWITTKVRVNHLKRNQIIIKKMKFKTIQLGVDGSPGMQGASTVLCLCSNSKLIFEGSAIIAIGTVLRCDYDAIIRFGNNFYCNCNCFLRSTNQISIGKDCSFGWNVILNTSDGHCIWHDNQLIPKDGPINIGNHVWITPNSSFVKNSGVNDGSIVAQGSVVTKYFEETHCLIGGIPAKVISRNIEWRA